MQSKSSVATLTLTPMTRAEAGKMVDRMLGSYPSLNLHDPETYIASICSLLCAYPVWAAEKALAKGMIESKFVPPTVGILTPILEDQVRTHRYAAQWDRAAEEQLRMLPPPRTARPTYEELKAKYGPNWGITNPDKPPPPTRDQCRQKLIAEIGQEAFDAIPDAGFTVDQWKKLRAPAIDEAAE